MDNTSKIICRKCKGNHLTIKCGKTGASSIEVSTVVDNSVGFKKEDEGERKPYFKKEGTDGERKPYFKKEGTDGERKPYVKKEGDDYSYKRNVNKVKIGSLPIDMTEEELNELLYDWGTVKHLRLLSYPDMSVAYVEFRNADEIDYLIKALDKTPFDFRIISIEKLDT